MPTDGCCCEGRLLAGKNARGNEIIRLVTLKAIAQGINRRAKQFRERRGAETMIGSPALDLSRLEERREVEARGGYT